MSPGWDIILQRTALKSVAQKEAKKKSYGPLLKKGRFVYVIWLG